MGSVRKEEKREGTTSRKVALLSQSASPQGQWESKFGGQARPQRAVGIITRGSIEKVVTQFQMPCLLRAKAQQWLWWQINGKKEQDCPSR